MAASLYWKNLSVYRAVFDDTQIHVAFMDDLKSDPNAFFSGICDFLGISMPEAAPARGHLNPSSQKRIPSELYSRLQRNPLVRASKVLAPTGLKRAIKDNFLTKKPQELPDFSPEVLSYLKETFREDARAVLAHTGKPQDFWDVAA